MNRIVLYGGIKAVEMERGEAYAAFKAAFRDGKEGNDENLLAATYIVAYMETLNSVTKGELRNALRYLLKETGVSGNCGD